MALLGEYHLDAVDVDDGGSSDVRRQPHGAGLVDESAIGYCADLPEDLNGLTVEAVRLGPYPHCHSALDSRLDRLLHGLWVFDAGDAHVLGSSLDEFLQYLGAVTGRSASGVVSHVREDYRTLRGLDGLLDGLLYRREGLEELLAFAPHLLPEFVAEPLSEARVVVGHRHDGAPGPLHVGVGEGGEDAYV